MKAVLISIQPKWVEKIANGQKTIEVRKTAPKCEEPFKCYIYVTKAKKWFHSGIIVTSDELLWLSSDKIKMCDGFELWADGEYYQCVNCKVIGEFVCDKVYEIVNGKSSFFCNGATRSETNLVATQSCLDFYDMAAYLGDKNGCGWHISDLKIYDKPKELGEFYTTCKEKSCQMCDAEREYDVCAFGRKIPVTRAPSNWQYVEEL